MARLAVARKLADDPLYLDDLDDRINQQALAVTDHGAWRPGTGSWHPTVQDLTNSFTWVMPNEHKHEQKKLARLVWERDGYERYRNQAVPTLNGIDARPGDRIAWTAGSAGVRAVVYTGTLLDILPNNAVRVEEDEAMIENPEAPGYGGNYWHARGTRTRVLHCTHALVRL